MKAGEMQAALAAARETAKVEVDKKLEDASFVVRTYSDTIHEWVGDVLPAILQDGLQAAEDWRNQQAREAKAAAAAAGATEVRSPKT